MSRKTAITPIMAAAACLAALPLLSIPAAAQYVGQVTDKSATHFRAVAVLEWTGDLAHPKASRLVPITVFDGQQLQDGSIYLARPQPLALDGEVEYEIQKDGKTVGFYDIHSAAQQQGYWIGFGNWKALPVGPTPAELARQRQMAKVDVDDENSDQPVLHRKHHDGDADSGNGNTSRAPADPDRPTLHKSGDAAGTAGSSSGNSGSNSGSTSDSNGPTLHHHDNAGGDTASGNDSSGSPAPDPDRPTLHKSTDDSASGSASTSSGSTDPDRPKLQKKQGQNEARNDEASVSSLPDVSDPDRPRLKRGKPAGSGAEVAPTLMGMPPEMEQQVAVSDAKAVKNHPWDFSWANPADELKMKSDMEEIARKALGLDQPAPAASSKPSPAKRSSVHKKAAPPPPPAPLADERFRVFELAYGSGATMVLSAHTDGAPAQQKFVTIVAQPDLYGSVVTLMKNVTDAAHLDVKPRMVLIDPVDAEGDNRGDLLFELRGQMQRQFALYRVYRGQMTQLFASTPEYWGSTTQGE